MGIMNLTLSSLEEGWCNNVKSKKNSMNLWDLRYQVELARPWLLQYQLLQADVKKQF